MCRVKISGWHGLIFVVALLSAGCQSISSRPASSPKFSGTNSVATTTNATALDGKWHSIQMFPSAKLPEIHTWQKFYPVWWFENSDEPVPPAWYRPGDPHRITKWHFRNPLHNFDFYVIGVADKNTVRSGRYPDIIANPHGGWNFSVSRRKIILLPFFDYHRGWFEFYFGWRTHGNFGIKLDFSSANGNQKAKPSTASP
jgi:hypothetical protein